MKAKLKKLFKFLLKRLKDNKRKAIKVTAVGALVSALAGGGYNVYKSRQGKKYQLISVEQGAPIGIFLLEDAKVSDGGVVCGKNLKSGTDMCIKTSSFLIQELGE